MNEENISFEIDKSLLLLIQMTLIFSAVNDGWIVKKLEPNKFCFKKKNETKHISLQSFLDKHIPNLSLIHSNSSNI